MVSLLTESAKKRGTSKSIDCLTEGSVLPLETSNDSGGTKEDIGVDNDDICLFLQKHEIGMSPEEATKTSIALGSLLTLAC